MNLLVIGATEFEIAPFVHENNTDVLITGVGIPATIFNLTKKLCQTNYDIVIQAGIAGTFSKKFKQSTVVMVLKDAFGDIGIDEKGIFSTLFEKDFIKANMFPFSNGWLLNRHSYFSNSALPVVRAITVNTVTDNKSQIKRLCKKFNPDIETMEGAAFHYVCLQQNVNFLQLRSISNEAGERDKQKWEMKNAIKNLNIELKNLVQDLYKI
jgi:futalosine hydrolase